MSHFGNKYCSSTSEYSSIKDVCSDSNFSLSYRGEKKGLQILLSYSQAGPGRKAKQLLCILVRENYEEHI